MTASQKVYLNYIPIVYRFAIMTLLFVPWTILFGEYKDVDSGNVCPQLEEAAHKFYYYYFVVSCLIPVSISLQYLMIRHNAIESAESLYYWCNYAIQFAMGTVGLLFYKGLIEAYLKHEEGCSHLRSLVLFHSIFNASFIVVTLLVPIMISSINPDFLERVESSTRCTEPYFESSSQGKIENIPKASHTKPGASSQNPEISLSNERYETLKTEGNVMIEQPLPLSAVEIQIIQA